MTITVSKIIGETRELDIKSSLFSLLYKRGSRGAARAAKSL